MQAASQRLERRLLGHLGFLDEMAPARQRRRLPPMEPLLLGLAIGSSRLTRLPRCERWRDPRFSLRLTSQSQLPQLANKTIAEYVITLEAWQTYRGSVGIASASLQSGRFFQQATLCEGGVYAANKQQQLTQHGQAACAARMLLKQVAFKASEESNKRRQDSRWEDIGKSGKAVYLYEPCDALSKIHRGLTSRVASE
ncbi:hypothetical protein Efla_003808 [Eimeria flavescens]